MSRRTKNRVSCLRDAQRYVGSMDPITPAARPIVMDTAAIPRASTEEYLDIVRRTGFVMVPDFENVEDYRYQMAAVEESRGTGLFQQVQQGNIYQWNNRDTTEFINSMRAVSPEVISDFREDVVERRSQRNITIQTGTLGMVNMKIAQCVEVLKLSNLVTEPFRKVKGDKYVIRFEGGYSISCKPFKEETVVLVKNGKRLNLFGDIGPAFFELSKLIKKDLVNT